MMTWELRTTCPAADSVLSPESLPRDATPGLNLTVAALRCQVFLFVPSLQDISAHSICQAPAEPIGHLRPDTAAKEERIRCFGPV